MTQIGTGSVFQKDKMTGLNAYALSERSSTSGHKPVLLKETLQHLNIQPNTVFLDGTFGGGGHTRAILDTETSTKVIALDQDPQAAVRAKALQEIYTDRFQFYSLNFVQLHTLSKDNFDGILLDLGLSSFQLDDGHRGFSFRKEAQLDMRMNPTIGMPANEFLETASVSQLEIAIRDYGEELRWRRVVDAILSARGTESLQTTTQFAHLVEYAIGKKQGKPSKIHPATKTFQGIRIFINDELNALHTVLPLAFNRLKIEGILAVITFQSLEDRIVKHFFRRMAGRPEHALDYIPQQMRGQWAQILTSKPIIPSLDEVRSNPRSRSAKLRILVKKAEHTSNQGIEL